MSLPGSDIHLQCTISTHFLTVACSFIVSSLCSPFVCLLSSMSYFCSFSLALECRTIASYDASSWVWYDVWVCPYTGFENCSSDLLFLCAVASLCYENKARSMVCVVYIVNSTLTLGWLPYLACSNIALFFIIQQVHTHPVATISSSRESKPNRAPRVTVTLCLLCTTALFLLLERTVEVYIIGTSVAIEQLMLVTVVVE